MPIAGHLAQPTRTTARKCAWALPPMPSLFGFAPGGVYHANPVARVAVRSYRTLSPLPKSSNPKGLLASAVCSLWHFPWGHPRRALPGTVLPWSPDFPLPCGFPHCMRATIRPSGRRVVGARPRESNRDQMPESLTSARSAATLSRSMPLPMLAGIQWRWNAHRAASALSSHVFPWAMCSSHEIPSGATQ